MGTAIPTRNLAVIGRHAACQRENYVGWLIWFALRQRVLVVVVFVMLLAGGVVLFQKLNIEAYPDPTAPMVDVITQVEGMSSEDIERYITIPIEVQMAGMPNLKAIRTISLFGLSDVKLQFSFDYTYEQALQQVLNKLSQLPSLPGSVQPQISPLSPIGEIYRYRLVGPPGYSVLDLKTLQDWVLQRRFRAIPGVVDVTGWGGKTKTYQIEIDFQRLIASKVTLAQFLQALNNANINTGGNTINISDQSAVIRAVGQIRTVEDINNTLITQINNSPIMVKDLATVMIGNRPRLGVAGINDDDDIVQGIVLMRRGEKSTPTIERVLEEVKKINASKLLPPGVQIEQIYNRKGLIDITTHTVLHNTAVGIALIFLIQWLFLGDLRSAVIVSATIPFALFFAIALLVLMGDSANLLSVGAIDFGLIVDATVIMVENIFRELAERTNGHDRPDSIGTRLTLIAEAASSVSKGIFFAAAIIIVGFVPLFTLSGVEGHIFGPMAKTYAFAIAGGLIATFTIAPALSATLLTSRLSEHDTFLVAILRAIYRPVLRSAVRHRVVTVSLALLLVGGALASTRMLGTEFLPKLEEGNLWIRATLPPTISIEAGNPYVNRLRKLIASFPEVETVVSQHGRPDDGTDAAGFFNVEFFVPLKREAIALKDELTERMLALFAKEFPGVEFNFSQYLEDNVAEAVSGVKGENSIKIYGNDLGQLTRTAESIKRVLSNVQGIADLAIFNSLGQPTVQIDIDREKAARFGLGPGDINAAVKTSVGGDQAGDLYEFGSDRHFPIIVRLAPKFRRDFESIRQLTIPAQYQGSVAQIPLVEVASVRLLSGAAYIYREQQRRYIPIKFSVRNRDLGGAVADAQSRIAEEVQLPPGVTLEWVGEFSNLQDAIVRLKIIVPITVALIALLLYINFSSVTDTLLALSVIPMALVGGILGLLFTGLAFSISAAIGFIALFGISVMEGIIVIGYFNHLIERGFDRPQAVTQAADIRMRPVFMTCVAAAVGLLPAALSTDIGSQVQRPLAVVVVSGMLFAPILILVILPVLVSLFSRRKRRPEADAARAEMLEEASG